MTMVQSTKILKASVLRHALRSLHSRKHPFNKNQNERKAKRNQKNITNNECNCSRHMTPALETNSKTDEVIINMTRTADLVGRV
jgi:hypothetical protein